MRRPSYGRTAARSDDGLPVCHSTTAEGIEAWVAEQVPAALRPAASEASASAASAVEERRRQSVPQWHQRIERAKYAAERAARQCQACEPENRLAARTLEQRWDESLREGTRLEAEFDRFPRTQPRPLGEADRDRVRQLAEQVPTLWHAATTTPADRRRIVRRRIEQVTVTVLPADTPVAVRIAWHGGAVQSRTVRRAVLAYRDLAEWPRWSAELASLHSRKRIPAEIAETLNRAGFRPPKRAETFRAGMVRRRFDELGLRPRVSRATTAGVLATDEKWLHDVGAELGLSPHTPHGRRRKGWRHARRLGGRRGAWAVWVGGREKKRLRELRDCPRVWSNRDKSKALRTPGRRK